MKQFIVLSAALVLISLGACKKDPAIDKDIKDPAVPPPVATPIDFGKVSITFNNMAGTENLALNTGNYINANGDSFTVSVFRYYISNIVLTKDDGTTYKQHESYHLVNTSNGITHTLELDSVPPGTYTGINFLLGVDSARNTSGPQLGALDPVLGMFWDWNQGYIFMMMEGKSPSSTSYNNFLSFHLGGFTVPYNCIRKITPTFGADNLVVSKDHTSKIGIKTDILKMFSTPNKIRFAFTSEAMGGAVGVSIADNCVNMFSVTSIEN